ncbi:MAG TPA: RNA polymerase sigma-70 factor [Membranihabitans sp.]|nr:RNA polymerase sigma-70 factor [Membranihabitans sp.]
MFTDEHLPGSPSLSKEKVFKALYSRYWETLYLQAYRVLGDDKACEDIVQEVFIDIWEKQKLDKIENLSAYLFQSVKFKTLMALRQNKIRDRHLTIIRELSPQYTLNHNLESVVLSEHIDLHLKNLPPKCREVFYKSRFENLKNEEIADQLNISKRTVETHISYALRYLRGVKELLIFLIFFGW